MSIERRDVTVEASRVDDPTGSVSTPSSERFVSPSWLAQFWSVHQNTVYRDIRKGALRAFRLPGGQYRVRLSDARRYGRPTE